MIFLWANFLLPSMVAIFKFAWGAIIKHCNSMDERHPKSQQALLRKNAHYKPIMRRLPYWIRKKTCLHGQIQAYGCKEGECIHLHHLSRPSLRRVIILCSSFGQSSCFCASRCSSDGLISSNSVHIDLITTSTISPWTLRKPMIEVPS